ncbi:hypothetical protein GGF32_002331, partial [Allomyces javanicus]
MSLVFPDVIQPQRGVHVVWQITTMERGLYLFEDAVPRDLRRDRVPPYNDIMAPKGVLQARWEVARYHEPDRRRS